MMYLFIVLALGVGYGLGKAYDLFVPPKKRFFNKMLRDTNVLIWNKEFQKYKGLHARESTRLQYDRTKEALTRTKEEKAPDKLEKAKADGEVLQKLLQACEQELKDLDDRIHGRDATAEVEGVAGFDQELEMLVQLRNMIVEYSKFNL